jgi:hypothetical protein
MANTMTLISSVTVGSGGAASIDFTSIPSTYTDLLLKVSVRTSRAVVGSTLGVKFNGSSSSYSAKILEGSGAAASSFSSTSYVYGGTVPGSSATASTFGNLEIYIPNYAGSTNKSASSDAVMENNATTSYNDLAASLWSNTAAINQITLAEDTAATIVQYSTAYLYGVNNA